MPLVFYHISGLVWLCSDEAVQLVEALLASSAASLAAAAPLRADALDWPPSHAPVISATPRAVAWRSRLWSRMAWHGMAWHPCVSMGMSRTVHPSRP